MAPVFGRFVEGGLKTRVTKTQEIKSSQVGSGYRYDSAQE